MGGSNKYYNQATEWHISAESFVLNNIGVNLKTHTINDKFSKIPSKHTIMAKGDSAASKNYWREEDI